MKKINFLKHILFIAFFFVAFLAIKDVSWAEEEKKWCFTIANGCNISTADACAGELLTQQKCIEVQDTVKKNKEEIEGQAKTSSPGCAKGSTCLENPIGTTNITQIFGNGIKVATGIMGSLALLVFIYGGFVWLTSAGNSEKIKTGTTAMVWAVIGIVVIFASYAIINLVLQGLGAS
ncbi:MAG: hypothetical protein ACD_18C00070G0004 [uncultured bacterium]|nr:MAG: hypothetical protein ACD_18C00070G0004 [uncultured bacterium]